MATANQVSQLFVALYNRAIDGVTAQQYSGRAYNQSFISEVIGLTPSLRTMTNQEFVELVYKNALGKDNNSDKVGIDYWVEQANTNNWRREQLTDNLLRSINAWADQNASTEGLSQEAITLASQGATVFRTKVAIAEQAATTVGGQADTYALTFGSGLEDVTILNYNTTKENNTKILQGIAARNPLAQSGGNTVALGLNPDTGTGQENFLAPGDPNIPQTSGSGSSAYVYKTSTDFDDTITGTIAAVDPTFTGDTQIDAGKGNDVLKLNMSTNFTGLSGDGRVTGVERIELNNTTVNDNVTFNASGIRDVYTYVLSGANGINLTNVAYNEYLLIEMNNIKSTGNTTTSSGASTVVNGGVTQITFDTTPTGGRLDLNFNGVGYDSTDNSIANHDILFGIGSGTAIAPGQRADDFASQAAGIGMLNIALTGNNYADIVNTGVNRITVGGNGSLTTNLSQGVTYFNGANATGSLNITAVDVKRPGENGSNIFTEFTTGTAADKVTIAVERLDQNASVNLGLGNDTLTLTGQNDHEARKNHYNFNTIENLVFSKLTGDALHIDLGTTVVTTPQDPIISGSGSKKTEIPQDPIITTTQDRSANLQTITFDDAANVQLTSLGKKNLKVTYNGATDSQTVLVDTEGTVNLVLNGWDDGTQGGAKVGAGHVNLSNAKTVNIDLTGQGFEGYLLAANAVDLNIKNYTGDKKLKLKTQTQNDKNDFSSVKNLTIDSEAQDINASGETATAHSVDLANADLSAINKITLKGTGGIKLGELSNNKEGIVIAGTQYSGRLETSNIFAGAQAVSITTKGGITTGNITANKVDIDLSGNITTTEGQYNNNIGTIYIERASATDSTGTLNYTAGISGTRGVDNADGTINDTQNVVVNANSATLNINGAGGVDKFNIEASSFTKSLTIAGNLGTVPNSQEALNNYDSVRIDLSKTSGVNLDLSNLIVSNPNDEGIVITASKGADNITLVAGANHDIVEFSAGVNNVAAGQEVYSVDLNNLRLANNQSFTIDGLTITNTGDAIVRAAEIARAISDYVANPTVQPAGFNVAGQFNSLVGDWAGASVKNNGTKLDITAQANRNVKDLNLSWSGNGNSDVPAEITAQIKASQADSNADVSAGTLNVTSVGVPGLSFVTASGFGEVFSYTGTAQLTIAQGSTSGSFTFSVPDSNGSAKNFTFTLTATAAATADTTFNIDDLLKVLNGTATTGTKKAFFTTANATKVSANWVITGSNNANFADTNFSALGITLDKGSAANANKIYITSEPSATTLTPGSTTDITLGSTTTTLTIPAGTPAGFNISETSNTAFSTVNIKAGGTKYEDLASLTVDGTTYKLQIINKTTSDFAFDSDKLVKLLKVGSTDTNATDAKDFGKWNNNDWSGSASNLDTGASGVYWKIVSADGKAEDVGVSFGALFKKGLGIEAALDGTFPLINGIKFATADATKWGESHDFTLTTTANFGGLNVSGNITPNSPQAANVETSTFSIANGSSTNTITITGAGVSGADIAKQVHNLLTTGEIDATFFETTDPVIQPAPTVRINGAAYSVSNAATYKQLFALPDGLEYTSTGTTITINKNATATPETLNKLTAGEITISQSIEGGATTTATAKISAFGAATNGEIQVTFGALKAGQSYTFNDKTVVATKDLSAGDVARAFTLTSDDSFDGAVILGGFDTNGKIVESEVLYGFSGADNSTLIIRGTTSQSITTNADAKVTGTGTIGVDTSGISAGTSVQGSDGGGTRADSYVTLAVVAAGGASAATTISANIGALDTVSNFDIANDGLRLKMGDGGYYGDEQALNGNVSTVLDGSGIYVDAAGSTLSASAANGVISFGAVDASGAVVDAANITLEQKLYVATNNIAANKVAGFAHEGDFYVVATGAISDSTTDDIVVRLAGVGGVTDIATILA